MKPFAEAVGMFRAFQRRGRFLGGQIAVHHRGELVVDEAVGTGWKDGGRRVTRATPFCVWSASKPLIAMTVAALEERGDLDVHAPIAELVPEFGANGKKDITTLDVLTHRSGVIVPELGRARDEWDDWKRGLARVFAAAPRYPRGSVVYHPYEFGWILAAVVEAAAKRPLVDVFDARIAAPAGLAPMRFSVAAGETADVAHTYLHGKRPIVVSGVRYESAFEPVANGTMLTSFVPGGSLMTTASALSAFYAALVGGGVAANGRRIFDAKTVATYTAPASAGWDPLNRLYFSFSRGFLVGGRAPSLFGPWGSTGCYGHGGAICTFAFGDPKNELSAALVTNGNWTVAEFAVRTMRLVHSLRADVSSRP
jgi:CubicO group peptidase (beta-lactamase class C family)